MKWSQSALCKCNKLQKQNLAKFEGKTFFDILCYTVLLSVLIVTAVSVFLCARIIQKLNKGSLLSYLVVKWIDSMP